MNDSVEYRIPIRYDMVFSDTPQPLEEYLKIIPREMSIHAALFSSNLTADVTAQEFMTYSMEWMYDLPKCDKSALANLFGRFLPGAIYYFSDVLSGFELLKRIFAIPLSEFNPTYDSELAADLLLKAILIVNTEVSDKYIIKPNDSVIERTKKKFLPYKYYDFDNRVFLFSGAYKFFRLREFLSRPQQTGWSKLGAALIKSFEVNSFDELFFYLENIVKKIPFKPNRSYHIIRTKIGSPEYKFLKKLSFNESRTFVSIEDNVDYTYFKTYPFIERKEGEFALISNVFFSYYFYIGLRFKLSKLNDAAKPKLIKEFLAVFGKQFSEEFLLYGLLQYIWSDCSSAVVITEEECIAKKNCDSPPDGYVRVCNKILLFENKAHTLNVNVISGDNDLETDIKNNLVGEKGTGQLKKNIERIKTESFPWDEEIPVDYTIYPILVVDDFILSTDGMNYYINQEVKFDGSGDIALMPITVLDIDTFILIADLIKDNSLDFFKEIEAYHSDKKIGVEHCSFLKYLSIKYELRSPDILQKYINEVYNKFNETDGANNAHPDVSH